MKVEDAVRAFLHSLVKFLNNKNYLTSNVEVEFFEVEFFEINSLENIIQSVRGTISDQKISDILNINCCNHLSCGQKRFPLFELFFALEFKPQDLILEPWYFQV